MKQLPTVEDSLKFTEFVSQVTRDEKVVETTCDEFEWFLDVLPPRWMSGSYFAFAEGATPFRLFWRKTGRYFARQLSAEETDTFCRLGGIPFLE